MKNKFNNIDFMATLKPVSIAYAAIIIIGIILTVIFGANLDINFKGGTRISYSYQGDIDTAAVTTKVNEVLGKEATVSTSSDISGSSNQLIISLVGNSSLSADIQENLNKTLLETYPDNKFALYDSNSVSPTIAGTFFAKSLVAVVLAGIGVVIYVGIRFRKIGGVSAALMAYVALVLDCIVAFLTCTIFRLPVDSNLIAVILTLLGYSLNDTIVIYDRIRENKTLYPGKELKELVNESVNSVKVRTFVTTLSTVIAIVVIILVSEIFGLSTLRSFAIPMAAGLISGCVSSLFISSPLWVLYKTSNKKAK